MTCLAVLEAPETYTSGKARHLNRELSVIVDQLQAATTAWEAASAECFDQAEIGSGKKLGLFAKLNQRLAKKC